MNVQVTADVTVCGVLLTAGLALEIPREFFQPASMTRIGPNASVTGWSTVCPNWSSPTPIPAE